MSPAGKVVEEFQVDGLGEVKLRYPTINDAEDMREYLNSMVEEKANISRQEKVSLDEELDWLSDNIKEFEKGKQVDLVVDVDGKVMGHGGIKKKKRALSHIGELGLGLRREIRGKGIGSKLMEVLLREAEEKLDVEIITLGVLHTNKVARNLYEKFGFEEVGRLNDGIKHYGEYKDLINMKKDLRE